MTTTIEIKGFTEFKKAIKRNPAVVRRQYSIYLTRALAELKREIMRPPWRVGSSDGGVPTDTGKLRQAHRTQRTNVLGRIYVDPSEVKYGIYVHSGTSKMKSRPWMDKAKENKKRDIEDLQDQMLKDITKDLAK